MLSGKICRLAKILKGSENFFIIPIDHGLTLGPIDQLAEVKTFIQKLPLKTINAVVAHKGLASSIQPLLIQKDISLILHRNLRIPIVQQIVSEISLAPQ